MLHLYLCCVCDCTIPVKTDHFKQACVHFKQACVAMAHSSTVSTIEQLAIKFSHARGNSVFSLQGLKLLAAECTVGCSRVTPTVLDMGPPAILSGAPQGSNPSPGVQRMLFGSCPVGTNPNPAAAIPESHVKACF